MIRLALTFLILACTFTYAAPMYKWVDENGITHFSERPPAEQPDMQAVDINAIPVLSDRERLGQDDNYAPVANKDADEPSAELEDTLLEAPEKNPELCEQARIHLGRIRDNSRIRARDPETGELTYLDSEQIAHQEESWQTQADIYCE